MRYGGKSGQLEGGAKSGEMGQSNEKADRSVCLEGRAMAWFPVSISYQCSCWARIALAKGFTLDGSHMVCLMFLLDLLPLAALPLALQHPSQISGPPGDPWNQTVLPCHSSFLLS